MIVHQVWIACDRCKRKALVGEPPATAKSARRIAKDLGFRDVQTVLGWASQLCPACAIVVGVK